MEGILDDLRIQVAQLQSDAGGERDNDVNSVAVGEVMDVLERECRELYTDTGNGIHFVGVLLAVLVAEVVSRWWERRERREESPRDKGPARMVTCLYSNDRVAFVLSHPSDVHPLRLSEETDV
jgi:hypothetical protein